MSISLIAASAALFALVALYGPRLTGQFMAWQETQRLLTTGADPNHINPPAQNEAFKGALTPVWAFNIINGAGQIGRAPGFHNTTITLDQGLTIAQHFDPAFLSESSKTGAIATEQYNNATLIGFQGYQPIPGEDVLFEARLQASPNFYGTAGFMLQPQGTIQSDGNFQGRFNNSAFTLFGICLIGPESKLHGKSGVTVQRVINWWPETVQALDINMHELHTYQLRLHWVDERTWLGTTLVDGQAHSAITLPPLGPVEVHLWSDNYTLGTSRTGVPQVGYQNGDTKWVRFEAVSAWTETIEP